jgi:hypothetical protein
VEVNRQAFEEYDSAAVEIGRSIRGFIAHARVKFKIQTQKIIRGHVSRIFVITYRYAIRV